MAMFVIFLTFPACPSCYHALSQSWQLGKVYDRHPVSSPGFSKVAKDLGALLRDFQLLWHFREIVRSLYQYRLGALEKYGGPVREKQDIKKSQVAAPNSLCDQEQPQVLAPGASQGEGERKWGWLVPWGLGPGREASSHMAPESLSALSLIQSQREQPQSRARTGDQKLVCQDYP